MVPPQTDTPQLQSGKCVFLYIATRARAPARVHNTAHARTTEDDYPLLLHDTHTHTQRENIGWFLQTGGIAWTRFAISRSQCAVAYLSSECSPAHHGASWPNTDMRVGSQQMLYTISTIPGTDGARLSALPPRMSHRRSGGEPCLRDKRGRDRHFTSSACA